MGLALSCALTCVLWIAQTNTVFLQTAAPQVGAADAFGAAGNNNGKPKGVWVAQGPGPTIDGQVEGIEDGEVVGAVHTVAAHPFLPSVLFVGAVNGGVWRTINATSSHPHWVRLTDDESSLSIGALEFDPTDRLGLTLLAGIGRWSSFGFTGGFRTGLLRTRNAGFTWQQIDGGGVLVNKNMSGVAPRGRTIVVSVDFAVPFTFGNIGIWRSTDGGATFQQISVGNGAATGLPGGVTYDMVGDPKRPARLFTSVVFADLVGGANGVYRSDDTGATWTKVSNPEMDALFISTGNNATVNVEFAVGRHNNVYVAIANGGQLAGVFRSGDGGTTWTRMDLPLTNEPTPVGIHPGFQAIVHMSIVADPQNANIVYIGGDRQPLFREGTPDADFPNSIGAENFSGRLFRGDASKPRSSQWVHLTHSSALGAPGGGTNSNSSPHADSREMVFDPLGNLIETDDGGIYKRTRPRSDQGDWFSLNGDLQSAEQHDVAYDSNANIVFSGNQDTGTPFQQRKSKTQWETWMQADGGDVLVDDTSTPALSTRYASFQFLGVFNRSVWNAANQNLSFTILALTPLGGAAPPEGQFVTPLALNAVNGRRLLIGAANGLYESLDQGDTVSRVSTVVVNGTGVDPLAYGAADSPDVIYAGVGPDVHIRTGPAPAPLVNSASFPGTTTVTDIVIHPERSTTAFVSNTIAIFRTTDGGATWTDITGNLPTFVPGTLRSLAYVTGSKGEGLVVGTQNGVFFATAAGGFTTWSRLGSRLPTVPVFDLDFDRSDDVLIAGTMGRGAWKLRDASAVLAGGHHD
jgi:photosystem II stability/assembly factor-like uncharacterized protein